MEEKKENENKRPDSIDYYTYEANMARAERHVRRWMIAAGVLFVALVITNGIWVIREMMYEDVVITENTQDGEGVNLMGGGDINYGADKASD